VLALKNLLSNSSPLAAATWLALMARENGRLCGPRSCANLLAHRKHITPESSENGKTAEENRRSMGLEKVIDWATLDLP
jgi:hypothetical protein